MQKCSKKLQQKIIIPLRVLTVAHFFWVQVLWFMLDLLLKRKESLFCSIKQYLMIWVDHRIRATSLHLRCVGLTLGGLSRLLSKDVFFNPEMTVSECSVISHKAGQGCRLHGSPCGVGRLLLSQKASETWTLFSRDTQWKMECLEPAGRTQRRTVRSRTLIKNTF